MINYLVTVPQVSDGRQICELADRIELMCKGCPAWPVQRPAIQLLCPCLRVFVHLHIPVSQSLLARLQPTEAPKLFRAHVNEHSGPLQGRFWVCLPFLFFPDCTRRKISFAVGCVHSSCSSLEPPNPLGCFGVQSFIFLSFWWLSTAKADKNVCLVCFGTCFLILSTSGKKRQCPRKKWALDVRFRCDQGEKSVTKTG
jgi:hypothetical protein